MKTLQTIQKTFRFAEGAELGGMAMPSGETAAQVTEAAESSLFADILTYAFLGLVAAGFLWMLFDRIRALINRLSEWLEKFAGSVNEGFYDEREQLMSAEEVRENMKKRLRERVKQLFTRETPWEKLDGRGGGKPNFQQGSVQADQARIEEFFRELGVLG